MREESKDRWRINHIIEAIERIYRYVESQTFESFTADDMRYYAVVKNIEIIGEAANMLTYSFREKNSHIPWKSICGMRNYIVHEYFAVDEKVVWEVITSDLPILRSQLLQLKESLTENN